MVMNKKSSFTILLVIILISIALFVVLNVKPSNTFYELGEKTYIGKVTLDINCKTAAERYDILDEALRSEEYVPFDGVILQDAEIEIAEGDTVFDVLLTASKVYDIPLDFTKTPSINTVYINGINHLYEFSCGPLSGWLFQVNGEYKGESASDVVLKDGDMVRWIYSVDLGRDVNPGYEEEKE